jgi:hypothetical protein
VLVDVPEVVTIVGVVMFDDDDCVGVTLGGLDCETLGGLDCELPPQCRAFPLPLWLPQLPRIGLPP